jgi:hypothetical protein
MGADAFDLPGWVTWYTPPAEPSAALNVRTKLVTFLRLIVTVVRLASGRSAGASGCWTPLQTNIPTVRSQSGTGQRLGGIEPKDRIHCGLAPSIPPIPAGVRLVRQSLPTKSPAGRLAVDLAVAESENTDSRPTWLDGEHSPCSCSAHTASIP